MARATGPGRVHIRTKGRSTFVLLYNYDVDRADLKIEHMAYLRDHVIPLFIKPVAPMLFLRGLASRTHDAAYNLALSKRRVEA